MMFVRRKRLLRKVAIHLTDDTTVEGFLEGCWAGHYMVLKPAVPQTEDRTINLQGRVEIPRERVRFVQVLDA